MMCVSTFTGFLSPLFHRIQGGLNQPLRTAENLEVLDVSVFANPGVQLNRTGGVGPNHLRRLHLSADADDLRRGGFASLRRRRRRPWRSERRHSANHSTENAADLAAATPPCTPA